MTSILKKADVLINGERQSDYGSPSDSFKTVAKMWDAYLKHRRGRGTFTISPQDVCIMMALLKVTRLAHSPNHDDSLLDAIGYFGLVEHVQERDVS